MKQIRILFLLKVVLFGLAAIVLSAFLYTQVQAQGDFVSEITARLAQQNVPVKNIAITTRIPFQVEVGVQSVSIGEKVTPDDPSFINIIIREAIAVRNQFNIKLDTIRITIVNVSGNPIYWSDEPLLQAISSPLPSTMDNTAVAKLIRNQLPLHGMTLNLLDVSSNIDGVRILKIQLSAQDVQFANKSVPQFMLDLPELIKKLNSEAGLQIAIYKVDVVDAKSQPLLKYTYDLQLAQENWWQADGMSQDWFPHPPPSSNNP